MSTLVIVESPAKAQTIEKYLGKKYRVKASVGHVRDLPKSNKDAVDIAAGFVPHYVVSEGKQRVIDGLKREAKKADAVLLATDPDREGEAIAWHISELIKKDNSDIKRIIFHEITEPAVKAAIEHPRGIDQNLRKAQEARRVLDRLVGYDLSGLIWKKVRYGLSAGRVQSPALRMLMEREREIRAFKPEDFWVITANTETEGKESLLLTCIVEPRDEATAKDIVAKGKEAGEKGNWIVTDLKETAQKRAPRPPFTTSTLQQTASTRLGFSPFRTMGAAQKLYEAGHITYMRTDSVSMSSIAQKQILALVYSEYGQKYVQPRNYKTKSKSAQEAHEAIRPTNFAKHTAGATDDQKKLYTLIFERAVASQMANAELKRTKITANITNNTIPDFTANGSRVMFDGWLKVDYRARGVRQSGGLPQGLVRDVRSEANGDLHQADSIGTMDIEVPKVAAGDPLTLLSLESIAKQTQPPSRYSEAGLIKELEKRGIGRPSTYASIIKTITDRGYVEKANRTLIPTDTGDVVSSFLEDNFAQYISDTFTSEMEDELDEIAAGTREYEKTLKDFYTPFTQTLSAKEHIEKLTTLGEAPKESPCPTCGGDMVVKLGRSGKFLSCANFPDCIGARAVDGSTLKSDEPIGKHPETGEDIYVMTGRFGPYVQLGKTPRGRRRKTLRAVLRDEVEAKEPQGVQHRYGETPEKGKVKKKGDKKAAAPRRASIPKGKQPDHVTLEDAVRYLSLPRALGQHPDTGTDITASIGRFGPFIVHEGDFRSLKGKDNPYDITLPRALEILKEEKKKRVRMAKSWKMSVRF